MQGNPADLMMKVTEWISHPIEVENTSYSHVATLVNSEEIIEPQAFMTTGNAGINTYE